MNPWTIMMTRPITTMPPELFKRIIDQLMPFNQEQLDRWERFVVQNYGLHQDEMSESHYFLYVIPRMIVLYGYGDLLLDMNMSQ
jgi:hypothetical protein